MMNYFMHQYTKNSPGEEQVSRVCEQQTSLQMNVTRTHQSDNQLEANDTVHGD
jgi:hypothetical protein